MRHPDLIRDDALPATPYNAAFALFPEKS